MQQEEFDTKDLRQILKEFRDGKATNSGGKEFQYEEVRPKKIMRPLG